MLQHHFLLSPIETERLECETTIHDHLENGTDIEEEGETDDRYRWWVQFKFYGNDREHTHNASLCNIVRNAYDYYLDLETYGITKEQYDMAKEKFIAYNNYPLSKKEFPELTREERIRRHVECMNELYGAK